MTIGYIYGDKKLTDEDKLFLQLAIEKKIKVVIIPSNKFLTAEKIIILGKKCDIVLNSSAELESVEIAKIIEKSGVPVIDPTYALFYKEDKMLFYIYCKRHKIPTPKTYLLPMYVNPCREPLDKLIKQSGAVVIKNIYSDNGKFVDRAKTVKQALALVKKFRKGDRAPLIAQEFIKASHKVYRVTVIDGKVVQGAIKKSKHWKCTGRFIKGDTPPFHITSKLEKMCVKISKIMNLPWCGIDLMRKGNSWVAIEANSSPGMDFISCDTERMYQSLLKYLMSVAQERKKGK